MVQQTGKRIKVDLHLHTTVSDGLFTPAEVVQKAREAQIEIISITDHEAVSGALSAAELCKDKGPQVIPGAEFSTFLDGNDIHILGYFPGGISKRLRAFTRQRQEERINRIRSSIANLREAGCLLRYEDVSRLSRGESLSRAHLARALVAHGYVTSTQEAFNRYLTVGIGIVPALQITPFELIQFVRSIDAIPVWAHPRTETFDKYIKQFVDKGLLGVEISYSGRRYQNREAEMRRFYFERTGEDFGLYLTYGSDFHGTTTNTLTGITVPRSRIEKFLDNFRN